MIIGKVQKVVYNLIDIFEKFNKRFIRIVNNNHKML
jgi:hypothetical protein